MSEPIDVLEAGARALLASPRLTEPTRRVLGARLETRFPDTPQALSPDGLATLKAVSLRLIPEPELVARVQLAEALDARLAAAEPRGWRYAEAPADLDLIVHGLTELEASVQGGFSAASAADQDEALRRAQAGRGDFAAPELRRWFEEVLSALTELFYGHPLVQLAIGYDGMMDMPGTGSPRGVGFEGVAQEGSLLES